VASAAIIILLILLLLLNGVAILIRNKLQRRW
jgi:ABC-type phosphate transport system permease subunit